MTTHNQSSRTRAFTLIELMIVVAIVGVLSVVAGTAYRRYMDSARTTEVMAVLTDIRAKQEMYRAEFSQYCNASVNEDTYHPALLTAPGAEPAPKDWTVGQPACWAALGLRPGKNTLVCGYSIVAGAAMPTGPAPTGTRSIGLVTAAPTNAWWVATGTCDNDGSGTGTNVRFTTASNSQVVITENEHQ